jgi:hypothetical protein
MTMRGVEGRGERGREGIGWGKSGRTHFRKEKKILDLTS